MEQQESKVVRQALRVLGGEQQTPGDALKLAKQLKEENRFNLARRILGRARSQVIADDALKLKLVQQHALCTYKDQDILRQLALEQAFEILNNGTALETTDVKETLGIAGAICKRRFEMDNRKGDLDLSLHYYRRGHDSKDKEPDFGYTGINAAFGLDYLAHMEAMTDPKSESARLRREEAATIRGEVLTRIEEDVKNTLASDDTWDPRTTWWLPVTQAEAYLGLGQYDEARAALQQAVNNGAPLWEQESTARQLSRLAWLHQAAADAAHKADVTAGFTEALLPLAPDPNNTDHAIRVSASLLRGRVGLALSGGGFRASLFHLGVLAQLAEWDVLRDIEVLSCVSGGSIVGAHYYLELQRRLMEKADTALTQDDYINIVKTVSGQFLDGVQRNIRMRVFEDMVENGKMFLGLKSRTVRLGELYERELYDKVEDGNKGKPRYMHNLLFKPAGLKKDEDFNPNRDNWRRVHKVPTLILNATTLNTGHNWQFTGSWMGEPPEAIDVEIDGNERLRRFYYYNQAPKPYDEVRLGTAVAASSCVPGLFEPISFPNLYQRRCPNAEHCKQATYTVELVDGGVHDNQGASALLGQNCDVILVSDASGQSETRIKPGDSALPVLMRSNNVLMKRVRTAQFNELKTRQRNGQLRGLMFIHLRSDLDPDPEDWVGCQDPWEARDDARPAARRGRVTRYGVLRAVQDRLSAIRTDLDSFSDVEAHSLMLSGYRMAARAFEDGIGGYTRKARRNGWSFFSVEDPACEPNTAATARAKLLNLLEVGRQRAFKAWKLDRRLRTLTWVLAGLALLLIIWLAFGSSSITLLSSRGLAWMVVVALVGALAGTWAARLFNLQGTLWKVAIGAGASAFGWLGTKIHLRWFDPLFIRYGKVEEPGKHDES